MYKMMVSSFYNTLINKDESIALDTMLNIDRIRSKGILFTVSTSALFRTIIYYNDSYVFSDYISCYNGAYLYDMNNDKVLYKKNIPVTTLKKLIKLKGFDMAFCTLNDTYYIGKAYNYDFSIEITDLDDFISFHKNDIYQIIIHYKKKDLDEIIKYIKQFNVNYFFKTNGKDTFIEIIYKDIDKLNSIKMICDKKKIKLNEVVSVGGNSNDLNLISNTIGNCVKNGEKEVKKAAKYVTKLDRSLGVNEVILKYFEV